MEEFRSPIVDSLVITLINIPIFNTEDFERRGNSRGIYLKDQSRRIFLEKFEARMNQLISHPVMQSDISYREAIQLQVRLYKRCLVSSKVYEPFIRSQ